MKSRNLSLAALAAIAMSAPGAAQAACCVFDAASIVRAVTTASAQISSAVVSTGQTTAMQIVAAIKGAQAADAAVYAETAKQISDTIVRVDAVGRRGEIERLRDDIVRVSDPCSIVASTGMSTVISGATPVTQAGGAVGRDGGGAATARGGGMARMPGASRSMQKVLEVAKGAPAGPPEATAAAAAAGACETFASAGTSRATSCATARLTPNNSAGLPDADIRADTLFDGPQGTQPRKRYSINMAGNDRTAVEAFMRNLNTPTPLRQLSAGELSTAAGHQYLAARDQYEARMAMAERPMRRHIARMTATTENIPYVQTLLNSDDRAFVTEFLAAHSPNWQREGISLDEQMQIEVRRRYMNPEWIKRMALQEPAALAAEQLRVSALQNVLLLQVLEELREGSVTRAATDMAILRAEMGPQLAAAHRAAAR
jgi:hypothetical protein